MSSLTSKFEGLSISSPPLGKEQLAYQAQWTSVLKTGEVRAKLKELNLFLRDSTFLAATGTPVKLDVEYFEATLPVIKEIVNSSKDVQENCGKYRHVIRWVLFLQNLLEVEESERLVVPEGMELPREVIEKKKKELAGKGSAGATAGADKKASSSGKQQQPRGKPDEATLAKLREEAKAKKAAKKAAAAEQQGKAGEEAPAKIYPSAIDFRVGFIQKAIKHPDADSLYVSTIDVGEAEGPRTVCSGLVKSYPLEAMQERFVVVVCNLKPVNMRGIKSAAMVLCGSNETKVELVEPPANSKPGDKVFFEGFGDEEPLKQLNPKKKIWEQLQPHFSTNDELEVIFQDEQDKDMPVRKLTNSKGETFKVASIVKGSVN
ncbi:Arc1p Ecym_2264 [Eremothecium cymbalariae DBVPG|uniref:tRNA-binding domain-containing protein n=1 Tax=Eremothecium cymbalariae (strain CBS 270.75 / DBVPG 7215 / KCTC 17166 / NRRL Y-17582) TaxID=931890 RepID=G8JPQ5_ERECY|nr:Hypothetical protein Ecym_2264 [Eremothecium cymbalariae DBVPG\